jgi:hypothetical protein
MQKESDLFEVRVNEQGKKFIRKFVAISYTILVLVLFESAISIYWSIRMLVTKPAATGYPGFESTSYDTAYPYVSILLTLMAVVSNFYYIRFPRVLLRNIELNDEFGTNQAFSLLFKGALIFLLSLLLSTASMIWSLVAI